MADVRDRYTLLDVVKSVSEFSENDQELLATVAYLINSGKVRLGGDFAGSKVEILAPEGGELGAA